MPLSDDEIQKVVDEIFSRVLMPEEAKPFNIHATDLLAEIKAVDAESMSWSGWLQIIATLLATVAQAFAQTKAEVSVTTA